MKLIGVLSDGQQMLEALPQELADLAEAAETIQRTLSTIGSRAAPQTGPAPDRAEMPAGTARKPKKRQPRRAASSRASAPSPATRPAGAASTRPCIICGNPFAPHGPQKCCSKKCTVEKDRRYARELYARAASKAKPAAAPAARLDAIRRADQHVVDRGVAAAVAEAKETDDAR